MIQKRKTDGSPQAKSAKWPTPTTTIDLWPKDMPGRPLSGFKEEVEDLSKDPAQHFRRVRGVTRPRMAVFPAEKPTGKAMLIIPGGGFMWNYFDHEGYQLAAFLNQQGVTCFILFYRLARDGWDRPADVGLMDAQRAMRQIRHHAAAVKIDPTRVGVVGFSAGGFLAASLATLHQRKFYEVRDEADRQSARADLAGLIYAVQSVDPSYAYRDVGPVLFGGKPSLEQIADYSADRNVGADSSPCFIVHAEDDDTVPLENAFRLRAALKAHSIPVETHLFATGGHGFGAKPDLQQPYHVWPELLGNFMRAQLR